MPKSRIRNGSRMWRSLACSEKSSICPRFSICTATIWSAIPYRIVLYSAWWQTCWTRHLQKFQTEQTSFSIFLWAAQKWAAVFAGVPLHGALQTGTRCISGLLQHPQNQGKTEGLAACNSQTTSPFGCLNNFYFKILSNFLGALHAFPTAYFDFFLFAAVCARRYCCAHSKKNSTFRNPLIDKRPRFKFSFEARSLCLSWWNL